jgi:hypothetical protein
MSEQELVENVKKVLNKDVWLTEADFGGLYDSGKFNLNIQAKEPTINVNTEIFSLVKKLIDESPETLESIWRVIIH